MLYLIQFLFTFDYSIEQRLEVFFVIVVFVSTIIYPGNTLLNVTLFDAIRDLLLKVLIFDEINVIKNVIQ